MTGQHVVSDQSDHFLRRRFADLLGVDDNKSLDDFKGFWFRE